jgi:hypothetical protein
MSDRLTQIGEKAHGTVRHEDVCWMIDEIERLRNLKGVLMELGNRLVIEHSWDPFGTQWQKFRLGKSTVKEGLEVQQIIDEISTGAHTAMIAALTQQINENREMRELLNEFGFDWPVVEEDER